MRLVVVAAAALFAAGLLLRGAHLHTLHPVEADEYSWLLAGRSLLLQGTPSSWTIPWPFYDRGLYEQETHQYFNEREYPIVTPWLDHPPLFSLGTAGWAGILRLGLATQPAWYLLRLPMLALAAVSMLFLFLLADRLAGPQLALWSLAAYAFFPAAALSAPFLLAENAIATWFIVSLFAVYVAVWDPAPPRRRYAAAALFFLVATSPWLKLSGAVVGGAAAMSLVLWQRYKLALTLVLTTAVSIGAFAAYGWVYDWTVFMGAQRAHALRPQALMNFWSLFNQTNVANLPITDPAIVVGFIGLLLFTQQASRKAQPLLLGSLAASVLLLLAIAPVEAYSWYKFFLYPLLALGLGWLAAALYRGQALPLVLLVPLVAYVGEQASPFLAEQRKVFLAAVASAAAAWLIVPARWPHLKKVLAAGFLVLVCALEALWIWRVGSEV